MRLHLLACPIVLFALALPAVAQAQGAAPAGQVRRDPRGIKGISPFWEALKKGDNAYIARDYDGAISAYTEALTKEPQNALGHYRIAEAHLAKADFEKAEAAWQSALRYVRNDLKLRAKILFVLADLRERQQKLEEAKKAWGSYGAYLKGKPKATGYPATPTERNKRIVTWVEMQAPYAAVKERIQKRLAELEEKRRKDAK